MITRTQLRISGKVQGVGFRPFVYGLAARYKLKGFVRNDARGVLAEIEGEKKNIRKFLQAVKNESPASSCINAIRQKEIGVRKENTFSINPSEQGKDKFVFVPPDLAVCDECLEEMRDPSDRRFKYPFINCTQCGPRYTIIQDIPYDRDKTTMKEFTMCSRCQKEYDDWASRRFHAQPNACSRCGPEIDFISRIKGAEKSRGNAKSLDSILQAARQLACGDIVAVKGVGGYHLCCDARNTKTVERLRQGKKRPSKPFAVMLPDIRAVRRISRVSRKEQEVIMSPARPILLLRSRDEEKWLEHIVPGLKRIGVMLPYAPHQHLLFDALKKLQKNPILVVTSANYRDEPLAIDERAVAQLHIADCFLVHNRGIHVACEDSVVRVDHKATSMMRRARGYAPGFFEYRGSKRILGCGAEMKATFSMTKDNYIITSPYLGDLSSPRTYTSFIQTVKHFGKLFDFKPEAVAYDCHPGYNSSRYAASLEGVRKVPVQHHHAHAVSCMVEHALERPVIGVVFDGTGYGLDGNMWGGEFLVCGKKDFIRAGFFEYIRLPGGDTAVREPWRIAFSILHDIFGKAVRYSDLDFMRSLGDMQKKACFAQLKEKNYIYSSSVGRLFDAAASLLGLKSVISYEAEAAILLEEAALGESRKKDTAYPVAIHKGKSQFRVCWKPLFEAMAEDVRAKKSASYIARSFHNAIARAVVKVCGCIREENRIEEVVLSGGVFQNQLLCEQTAALLRKETFRVYTHSQFPSNDEAVSIGQVAIANAHIEAQTVEDRS